MAAAALADTLDVVRACSAERRVLALDGEPGDWLPAGFEVVAQRGDVLLGPAGGGVVGDRRALPPDRDGHPAGHAGPARPRAGRRDPPSRRGTRPGRRRRVVGDRDAPSGPDGLRRGADEHGPTPERGRPTRCVATASSRSSCRRCVDVDTVDDAGAVAALIPRSRTAAQLALIVERLERRPSPGPVAVR